MTNAIEGVVVSGIGKGKEFIALDGYRTQFQSKLGYDPYPGTLNLEVDGEAINVLDDKEPVTLEPWREGEAEYGGVDCYPVLVPNRSSSGEVPIHLIEPWETDHGGSTIELVSPTNLRERFSLEDESTLTIRIEEPEK